MPKCEIDLRVSSQLEFIDLGRLRDQAMKKNSAIFSIDVDSGERPIRVTILTKNILPSVADALVTMGYGIPGVLGIELKKLRRRDLKN